MESESNPNFMCVICQNILTIPMLHTSCSSNFCKGCIDSYIAENKANSSCPLCRAPISQKLLVANTILWEEIQRTPYTCKCGAQMMYSDYNRHYDQCPLTMTAIHQAIENAPKASEPVVNRSTYKCPHCSLKNLSRQKLIEHYAAKHRKKAGVCPICVVMPWGDPNYVSRNLLEHMQSRHQYDVDTYTDFGMDDDEIMQKILAESLNDR